MIEKKTVHETDPVVARASKLERLEALGVEPYPAAWPVDATANELIERYSDDGPEIEGRVAGRIVSLRPHGKTTFLHLADRSGRIQVYARRDEMGEERYELLELLDLGDYLGVSGTVFRTRTGEVTIKAREMTLLAKAMRPIPLGKRVEAGDESRSYHQVLDREYRYRQRYADLVANPESKEVFVKRAAIIRYLRQFLEERDFLEVETPALQPIYGGATARPFTTYHNTFDMELYLRIADELYLKRCVVGGIERVYEIAKDFRNEGVDRFHSPEFTMLEFYQAYADYRDLMKLTEELLHGLVVDLLGAAEMTYQGISVDLTPPWPRLGFLNALEAQGVEIGDLTRDALAREAEKHDVEIEAQDGASRILDALFKRMVEPDLTGPVFVVDHPEVISPLAKRHRDDPRLTERFEAYLFGHEWANAFSELNDPRDQRQRFEALAVEAAAGDVEAPATIDEDFLRALEYGMPPTAGMGVGVDRLVMYLTDQASIRDVILFPALRPEEGGEGDE